MTHVGLPLRRREDTRFLTGAARYLDDFDPEGALQLAFVRSPHAHARLRAVDVEAARAAPGVSAVVTGADLAGRVQALPAGSVEDGVVADCGHPVLARTRSGMSAKRSRPLPPGRAPRQRTPPSSSSATTSRLLRSWTYAAIRLRRRSCTRNRETISSAGRARAATSAAHSPRRIALSPLPFASPGSSPLRSSPGAPSPSTTGRPTCSRSGARLRSRTGRSHSSATCSAETASDCASSFPTWEAPSEARGR